MPLVHQDAFESYTSPSDRLKGMILERWGRVENYYTDGEELKFARSVKSFGRFLFTFMTDTECKYYDIMENMEQQKIEEIKINTQMLSEHQEKEIHKIMFWFAEARLRFLTKVMATSNILQKDTEVEFRVPKEMAELEDVRKMITEHMEGEDVGRVSIKT